MSMLKAYKNVRKRQTTIHFIAMQLILQDQVEISVSILGLLRVRHLYLSFSPRTFLKCENPKTVLAIYH